MNKKNFTLIAIALVLAGIYAVCFTGWFRPKTIHISHASRAIRSARSARSGPAATRFYFGLGDYYHLTEVKVVPLAALQTNKLAQPVWHLISNSGSNDVKLFFYGEKIKGMDPAVGGSQPEPLQPGVMYRIYVAAGKFRGQHDFQLGAPSVSPPKPKSPDSSDD
jgi:hypothetical protein